MSRSRASPRKNPGPTYEGGRRALRYRCSQGTVREQRGEETAERPRNRRQGRTEGGNGDTEPALQKAKEEDATRSKGAAPSLDAQKEMHTDQAQTPLAGRGVKVEASQQGEEW